MVVSSTRSKILVFSLSLLAGGCSSGPQPTPTAKHGVIDGLGDIARASIERKQRVAGAMLSAVAGAGGSLLVGARHEKLSKNNVDEALQASVRAERSPAKPDDVAASVSADLNGDGFVTLDEVVALKRAKLSAADIISRLQKTQQVFELADWQEQYLNDRGVDRTVISAMHTMNREPASAAPAAASAKAMAPNLPRGG